MHILFVAAKNDAVQKACWVGCLQCPVSKMVAFAVAVLFFICEVACGRVKGFEMLTAKEFHEKEICSFPLVVAT